MSNSPHDLPKDFEQQMRVQLEDQYNSFRQALTTIPPVSIRLNPLKPCATAVAGQVPWCESGRYLEHRPSFTLDPHFHAGAYYVQEASSMFLEQAVCQSVDLSKPLRVLDLCAAPGGKSTHMLSLLSRDSLLVANDAIRSRAFILSENIQKWGYPNAVVTNNDPAAFSSLPGFFDVIVIDAPCSGEGLFRKDPGAVNEWSADAVALCTSRQRRILQDVWPALKTNGILVYCTCTYNESENEHNLKWLSWQHDIEFIRLARPVQEIKEISTDSVSGYRFYPHLINGEGFFISVIRKLDDEIETDVKKKRADGSRATSIQWLKGEFTLSDGNAAMPVSLVSDVNYLSDRLNVITKGVAVGTTKHGKFVPEHALALSVDIDKEKFQVLDLPKDEAIQYLRKDNLVQRNYPKGVSLVQFEGNPIGWANVLDSRINNMYPSNWRIKHL